MKSHAREQSSRCRTISLALQLVLVLLAVRLIVIQVGQHRTWLAHAVRMEQRTVTIRPQRGVILDRNGHKLAVTVKTFSLFANPRAIPASDREAVAQRLVKHLALDMDEVLERLAQVERVVTDEAGLRQVRPNYFVWIDRKVPHEKAVAVLSDRSLRGRRLPGIGIRPENKRVYPNGSMLCHVLGFVGVDGEGLEGLEARFDSALAGAAGKKRVRRDGIGRAVGEADGMVQPARNGRSLLLTVDSRIQRIVEEELAAACKVHKPRSACAVVMDPHTGDILAMAGRPVFDPARFREAPADTWRNMAVAECLEPGSTFKPFVAAAAIDHGVVTPETRFNCHNGRWRIGRRVLRDSRPHGVMTVREIVVFSSNIGMARVGMRLGPQAMYQFLRDFGFGRPSRIELPGESAGILRHPRTWSRFTISSLPMGQEVACSPVQLTAAFCVFANGGWYVRPRILLGLADTDGRRMLSEAQVPERRRVLSEGTANLMCNDLLAGVVERGTARRCAISGYRMAGKTGTAQIARLEGGGYEPGAYTAIFAGIVPADSPRVVIVVLMKKPGGRSYYGGVVAAPAVARMAERILSMYRIPRVTVLRTSRPLTRVRASGSTPAAAAGAMSEG